MGFTKVSGSWINSEWAKNEPGKISHKGDEIIIARRLNFLNT